jgi:hypothetical protein
MMGEPETVPTTPQATESSDHPVRARRRRSSTRKDTRGRLRKLYFCLAAAWGFLIGTGAVLVGLAALGRPLHLGPVLAVVLGAAGVLAVAGGLIASIAYRDASNGLR